MRATRFTVAAEQRGVGGLEEDHHGGDHSLDGLDNGGETLELRALADVNDQRRSTDFGRLHCQFREARDQVDWKIVDAVVTEVFEGFERGGLPGAAQARDDDEFRTRLAFRNRSLAWRLFWRAPGFFFDFLSHLAGMVAEFAGRIEYLLRGAYSLEM